MRLGKDKQYLLLVILLGVAISAGSQPVRHYKYHPGGKGEKTAMQFSGYTMTISYVLPELNIESFSGENGTFYRLIIPGHIPSSDVGTPEMPVLSRLIEIPEGYSYKIRISDVKTATIRPSGKKIEGILYPVQEGETKDPLQQKRTFSIDKSLYSTRGYLKSDTVKIEKIGRVRQKNLASLHISPVKYNPHSNILSVITSMKIDVIFTGSVGYKTDSKEMVSPLFASTFDKGLLNYDPASVINGYSEQPVRMVILTDTSFTRHLEPFLKWKTQKGFRLDVLYRGESLAGNTYTELKDTLTRIYNAGTVDNPPPEYLLIIGDVNKIPYYGSGIVTDMYYGEFDGDGDYIPEMFIGRLPVADTAELRTVIDKIIQYEKYDFEETNDFASNAVITAGSDASYSIYMNGQVNYGITNYLTPGNNINGYHFYYPQDLTVQKDSIIKLINKGVSFINYSGHGESTGWLHVNIKNPDIISFTNKDKYPFIIANACGTSQFNLSTSFGTKIVTSGDNGAIGYIGCSNSSYWNEDFYWAVGLSTPSADPSYETSGLGALDRLFHTHGESPSDWYITMGQVIYAGNLAVSASTSTRKKYYWEIYNLVGDPSVIPITGTPATFNVVLPDTLPENITSWSFISEPFSYVAVSHYDTLWDASHASPSGSVTLKIPGLTNDSCLVVITGQNKKPLIKTIYFSDINREFINLKKTSINDASGNNNGLADFGETFDLGLTISNMGSVDATNLRAIISSTSEWVTINNDSLFIGTLTAGAEIERNQGLSLTITDNVPDNGIATIDLFLKDDADLKHYRIDIRVNAPILDILSFVIDDSKTGNNNMIADPGEVIELIFRVKNSGSSSTTGLLKITGSEPAYLTVLEPDKSAGMLEPGEISEVSVLVRISQSAGSGTTIDINSLLDCDPYIVSRKFSFRIGRIRESFESASFSLFPWINISSKPWTITGSGYWDGAFAARSGLISNNQTTTLSIKAYYPAADSIKFYYKVSSEPNYDSLSFRINGKSYLRKSGETGWERAAIPVSAGYNKFEWSYRKDASLSAGMDCAMIDMIDFAGPGTAQYIQRDIVTARLVSPVKKENLGRESVILKLLNTGPDTIDGFNLAYKINNGKSVTQFFNQVMLPSSDSVTVTFDTKADLSQFGMYDIVAYSYGNRDQYLFNDTVSISIMNDEIDGPLMVYPNPFNDVLNVMINSESGGIASLSIYSSTGKKIKQMTYELTAGLNNIVIDNLMLIPSVYYLKVESQGILKTVPLVRIR